METKDIDRIRADKANLPDPYQYIAGGDSNVHKANSYGQYTLKVKQKLKKYDFMKLKEKRINVTKEDIDRVEKQVNKMRVAEGRRL